MKKLLGLIGAACFMLHGQAQIKIGNYRYDEMLNWNSNVARDVQIIKSTMAQVRNHQELVIDVGVLFNAKPTHYAAVFHVRQVSRTAGEANKLIMERINGFMASLESKNLNNRNITIDHITQVPIYGLEKDKKLFNKTMNEVPIGFEIQKNIIVPFAKYNDLNNVVLEGSNFEIYDLIKIDHFTLPTQVILDSMRLAASEYISRLTTSYSKLGVRLDTMKPLFAESNKTIYPISRYQEYKPMSRVGYDKLLPATSTVYIESSSAKSLYYNPLSQDGFQVVLHPDVMIPAVQHTLQLQLKFFNYPKPTQIQKEVYTLMPDGNIRLVHKFSR
jgi:hypothetical protein